MSRKRVKKVKAAAQSIRTQHHLKEVRHSEEFVDQLTTLSDASVGVIIIRTREPYRCQDTLRDWTIVNDLDLKVWTILDGWKSFATISSINNDTNEGIYNHTDSDKCYDPIKALDKIKDYDDRTCAVMFYPHYAFEVPGIHQHIKDQVHRAYTTDKRLLLMVPEVVSIPKEIESDVSIIDFKTPSYAELKEYYESLIGNIHDGSSETRDCRPHFSEDEIDLLLNASSGMSVQEFESALAIALVTARESLIKDRYKVSVDHFLAEIQRTKMEVLKKTDILELMPSEGMGNVGGLDLLKKWVSDRKSSFSDEAKDFGIEMPKGMLIVGPPGGGKSLTAKAISTVLGIPCIKFDIGKIFGHLVGQSEEQMRGALKMIEAMAPCVLLVDEIDKGFGGIGGSMDGGTTQRVFGTFLTWMQDRPQDQSPVFVVATANNIVGMPPELLRRGRFDEIFAVTFPTEKDRAEIFKIHIEKRGHKLSDAKIKQVVKHTANFVGSELEAIVKSALIAAFNKGDQLTEEYMIEEAQKVVPISKAFKEKVEAMNKWAQDNALPASSDMSFGEPRTSSKSSRKIGVRRGRHNKTKLKASGSTSDD